MTVTQDEEPRERHFSHSSMTTWRRCKVRYKWSYIDNYQSPQSLGQLRGSAGHAALAKWYSTFNREESVQTAAAMYSARERETGDQYLEDWDLLELLLRRYFDWSEKHDDFDEVMSLEQKFEFTVNGHVVIGYIDGVVRIGTQLWLLEHKFNKRVEFGGLDLDPQISMYMLACKRMGLNVSGVMFNVIRVAEGGVAAKSPVERRKVYRNSAGTSFFQTEVAIQLQEMVDFHKNGGLIYRTPTKDCSWDCSYFNACLSLNDDGNMENAIACMPQPERIFKREVNGDDVE